MIEFILIFMFVAIFAFLLFAGGPDIIEWYIETSDGWRDAIRHLRNRRKRGD